MSTPIADTVFELCVYLVSAARGGLDESSSANGFRMIEAVSRFVAACETASEHTDPFLREIKAYIDEHKLKVTGDRAAFAVWLDELLRRFAAEAKARNLAAGSGESSLPMTPLGG